MKARLEFDKVTNKIENIDEKFLLPPDISQESYRKTIATLKAEETRVRSEL